MQSKVNKEILKISRWQSNVSKRSVWSIFYRRLLVDQQEHVESAPISNFALLFWDYTLFCGYCYSVRKINCNFYYRLHLSISKFILTWQNYVNSVVCNPRISWWSKHKHISTERFKRRKKNEQNVQEIICRWNHFCVYNL